MPQVETSDPQKNAQNTALFVECVTMYAHQAMIAMGKVVNPITKKAERNLDAARLFIDMLEMLEAKTKGNLSREEERLLQSSLGSLRLTYVEEAQSAGPTTEASTSAPTEGQEPAAKPAEAPAAEPPREEESKKKFSKKYD
jgi:hypothetical protein